MTTKQKALNLLQTTADTLEHCSNCEENIVHSEDLEECVDNIRTATAWLKEDN